MRTDKEIMEGLSIFYTDKNKVFLVQDNYCKSFSLIRKTIEYAQNELGLVFNGDDAEVQVLRGERFKHVMSIEFTSQNTPSKGTLLTKDSGLWEWLKY
jgi:hypothetical protein